MRRRVNDLRPDDEIGPGKRRRVYRRLALPERINVHLELGLSKVSPSATKAVLP